MASLRIVKILFAAHLKSYLTFLLLLSLHYFFMCVSFVSTSSIAYLFGINFIDQIYLAIFISSLSFVFLVFEDKQRVMKTELLDKILILF